MKSSGTAPANCTDTASGNVIDFGYNFSLGVSDNGNVTGITNNRDTMPARSQPDGPTTDLLNFTDPTGLYTCQDDQNKCQTAKDKAFENARQRDLQSKDPDVVRAAKAYDDPTKDNKVAVQFTDGPNGNTHLSVKWNGQQVKFGITVSIPKDSTGTALDAIVGHEGTHVGQDLALAASVKPDGSRDHSLNLTSYDSENPAFHVQISILLSTGQSFAFGNKDQYQFNPDDTPDQTQATINRFLADPASGYGGITPQNPGPRLLKPVKGEPQ